MAAVWSLPRLWGGSQRAVAGPTVVRGCAGAGWRVGGGCHGQPWPPGHVGLTFCRIPMSEIA